jgi:hypothetical protein
VKKSNHNPQQGLGSPFRNPTDGAFWAHLSFSAESLSPERFSPGSFAPMNFSVADFHQIIFARKALQARFRQDSERCGFAAYPHRQRGTASAPAHQASQPLTDQGQRALA